MHQIGCPQRRNLANTTEPSVCGGDVAFIKFKSEFPKLTQSLSVEITKMTMIENGLSVFWKFALQLL